MKISVAHIYHGCDGVGVGVRDAAAFLALELGAGFTLADYFFNGLVDAGPEETYTCKQL